MTIALTHKWMTSGTSHYAFAPLRVISRKRQATAEQGVTFENKL